MVHISTAVILALLWLTQSWRVAYALLLSLGAFDGPDAYSSNAPTWLGVYSLTHSLGLACLVALLLSTWPRGPAGNAERSPLGLQPASRASWVVAAVAGLGAGPLSTWLGAEVTSALDAAAANSALSAFEHELEVSSPLGVLALVTAMTIAAPVVEELFFRGYLWNACERLLSPGLAFIITTAAFMAYHLDPVHAVGVAPLAVLLAMLRRTSGSVWPGVALHAINNFGALAVFGLYGSFAGLGLSLPLASAAFLAAFVAIAIFPRGAPTPTADP